ncbi:AzlC family ABC transporter permease [Phyllobacterium zundukense]|jgi:predicted branched-subunit amino acid permease|uniref:AzlC family ABC transporter permease n=1 Tax=Phyllobacterium zundukense TaxID=1867719 RepID=A0ACD4D1F7_9HYPH|nr:AzlC family ABC transporter permease [Phyllobacterium zundukense]UXN59623.1 AzlC family ABC transporter permease [Phyllobacterium zundukense]
MDEQVYQRQSVPAEPGRARTQFWEGFAKGLPIMVASAPFGLLFGALAVDNGFTVFQAVLMSAAIFGGASQMVGIELFGHNVPAWLIVFSIFAVNFRHVLYSAAVGRRIGHFKPLQSALSYFLLTDPQYAETEKRAESAKPVTFIWYLGVATPIYVMWVTEAWIGGLFGNLISDPHALGIDMLLPIYFLGLVMGFRKRDNWAAIVIASAVVSIIAYKTIGSPWHVSIGALAGILMAVIVAKPEKPQGQR